MSTSVDRVRAALDAAGLRVELRHYPDGTHTAQDAADAIGVDVGQIVKSLVFASSDSGEIVLVLTSGANRVDVGKVGALVGASIGRADPDVVRARTGFAIGGVPPVGHAEPVRTFVDEDLWCFDEVWAAAGTPRDVFAITAEALLRASGGTRADVKRG